MAVGFAHTGRIAPVGVIYRCASPEALLDSPAYPRRSQPHNQNNQWVTGRGLIWLPPKDIFLAEDEKVRV